MSLLLLITGLGLAHMVLRCWPIWAHRDQGCDAYYYLLCAEDFSRRRRLPIVLPPYYLLEPQDQAYPPLMSVLLGLLPGAWLKRYYWLITPLIDFASAAILLLWIGARFGPAPAVLAVLAYSANASLVAEFSALTSRALALFECNGFVLATYLWTQGWAPGVWLAAVLMALLLYTHKLSIQLLWFLVPFLALALGDWRWFVPFAAGYGAAFGVAPRYFLRVLYAHYDIVRYWRRNWPLLNAHMIRQSPLYGRAEAAGFYRRHDLAWLGRQIAKVLDYNCFILFAPLAAVRWPVLEPVDRFALLWCVGTVACGLATYFVPALRCFGEGNKYFKYALAPSLMLAAASVLDAGNAASLALLLFCAGWTLYSYRAVWHWLDGHLLTTGRLPPELRAVLTHCRSESRIMCLPPHFADIIAYHLRCGVMWGGHNYEFKRLQPFYPVLLQRIESFVAEFALTHLVLDEAYVRLDELCLAEGAVRARNGSFVLVEFGRSEGQLAASR